MKSKESLFGNKKNTFYINALTNYFDVLDAIDNLERCFKYKNLKLKEY